MVERHGARFGVWCCMALLGGLSSTWGVRMRAAAALRPAAGMEGGAYRVSYRAIRGVRSGDTRYGPGLGA
jgi:hypothetical protein